MTTLATSLLDRLVGSWALNRTLVGRPLSGVVIGKATFSRLTASRLDFLEQASLSIAGGGFAQPLQVEQRYTFLAGTQEQTDAQAPGCDCSGGKRSTEMEPGVEVAPETVVTVQFSDGRLFLTLPFADVGAGPAVAKDHPNREDILPFCSRVSRWVTARDRHLCGNDTYDAQYTVGITERDDVEAVFIHFRVAGPAKDYVANTWLTRLES